MNNSTRTQGKIPLLSDAECENRVAFRSGFRSKFVPLYVRRARLDIPTSCCSRCLLLNLCVCVAKRGSHARVEAVRLDEARVLGPVPLAARILRPGRARVAVPNEELGAGGRVVVAADVFKRSYGVGIVLEDMFEGLYF